MKMEKISQIFIVLLVIIKFEPRMCYEIPDLQNDEKINTNFKDSQIKVETSIFESLLTIPKAKEITAVNNNSSDETTTPKKNINNSQVEVVPVLKENSAFNKSIEYLIEGPNNSNSSHNQDVIIKPLNEFSVNLKDKFTTPNSENEEKLATNLTDMENQFNVSIIKESLDQQKNLKIENSGQTLNTLTELEKEKVTLPVYEKKEELIINLLNPQPYKVTTSILKESIISYNKSDIMQARPENHITTALIKETNQILKDRLSKESTMTSIKMRINPLNKILKFLTKESATLSNIHKQELSLNRTTTENMPLETINEVFITPTYEKMEDFKIKPVKSPNQYIGTLEKKETINSTYDHVLATIPTNFKNHSTESEQNEFTIKFENVSKQLAVSNGDELTNSKDTDTLVQTLNSPSLASKSEEEESTTKHLTTFEDYAVKQMNFILDHMLLESQNFVAKVLQATGNTIFQRDHLKLYAENINRLLYPQLESDYSDDISDSKPVTQQDYYEEVVKKLNFFKSQATKELQKHLPADWVKDYKDIKEELKIWLDKASNEMHREFNLYINEEEDHIKYLYFNEAFDDITRATEIHQKLALLADLIKIVKNKKQITFMDLYMQ